MALVEKSHSGKATQILALSIAAILLAWLAAFLFRPDNLNAHARALGTVVVVVFFVLGWRRWPLGVDIVLVNIPLWMLLPLRLGVRNFSLAEMAFLALAAGGALRVAQTRRFTWVATPLTPYLALTGLAVVLSGMLFFVKWFVVFDPVFLRLLLDQATVAFSTPDGAKFHTLRGALTLIEGFVLFHVVAARARDARGMRHLVQLSLLSAILVGLFGIFQYFTSWNVADFGPWRERINSILSQRVNSTFPDVNSLASFLVANLFMLAPLLTFQGWKPRGMAWWALPILAASFYGAHSRIAFGAFALTLPLYGLLRYGNVRLEKPVVWLYRKRTLLAVVFVLLLAMLGFVFMGLDWQSHTDLDWTRTTGPVAKTLKGRLNIWRSAFYSVAEHPWFGTGVGTGYIFPTLHWEPLAAPADWNWNPQMENAHNYFIQLLVETGVLGAGLFLLIVGLLLYQGLRAITMHRGEERAILDGILCGLVAFLLTCLTGHPLLIVDVNLWFWFIAALVFVPSPAESPALARAQLRWTGFRRVLLAVVLLVAAGQWIEAARTDRPTFYGLGIHDLEYEDRDQQRYPFFWLEKSAVCTLYQMYPDLEFCLRNTLGAQHPINVTIRVNGWPIDEVHLADAKWRVCSYRLPETIHTLIRLEILSDYERVIPGDRRRLSVQIQSLLENASM